MSDEAIIAAKKPCLIKVKEGKTYLWCACGRSGKQPFCDFSHEGTGIEPIRWKADASGDRLFCACKRTSEAPFCDGTHNMLSDTYAEADENDGADAVLVDYAFCDDGTERAFLDNGCFVVRAKESVRDLGTLQLVPIIGRESGAEHLSQFLVTANKGESPIVEFPNTDVVLFVDSGSGSVRIGPRQFAVSPETGVCVKPGEAFQIINNNDKSMVLTMSACPLGTEMVTHDEMPAHFDDAYPERVQGVDLEEQEAMGDRFFQVLIDSEKHGTPVTQFIGEIPKSRAPHHHHLYEETIMVLSGEGFMWTDNTKTAVKPGDTIFLPLKQAHSLECTTEDGMRLIGLFYPSMSPAINY